MLFDLEIENARLMWLKYVTTKHSLMYQAGDLVVGEKKCKAGLIISMCMFDIFVPLRSYVFEV